MAQDNSHDLFCSGLEIEMPELRQLQILFLAAIAFLISSVSFSDINNNVLQKCYILNFRISKNTIKTRDLSSL